MEPRAVRGRRLWSVTATLLALMGGVAVAPAGADPVNSGTRTVDYHGYAIDVPAGWQVVDLTEQPDACIRFDRPTVYLGRPGARSDCPAHLVGRTAGLLVEPLDASSAQRITGATARAVGGTAV
ncbi:hypothetical protein AB0M96_01185, partial [Streptomyces sp. NPDC051098]